MSTAKQKKRKRSCLSCLAAAALMMLFVVLIVGGLYLKNRREDTEPLIREGRKLLDAARREKSRTKRLELVHRASTSLGQCIAAGDERATPKLLFAASLAFESALDAGTSQAVQQKVETTLSNLDFADCEVEGPACPGRCSD